MKKVLLVALALMMVLCVVGCGAKPVEEAIVGVWQREGPQYLEKYGCVTDYFLTFNSDGSCLRVIVDHETNEVLKSEQEKWIISGDEVIVSKNPSDKSVPHTTYREFDSTKLTMKNGDNIYKKNK